MPKIQVRPKPKYDIASWRKNGADNFSNNRCIQRFTMPTELYFVLTVGEMEQRRSPYLQHHSSRRRFYSNDSEIIQQRTCQFNISTAVIISQSRFAALYHVQAFETSLTTQQQWGPQSVRLSNLATCSCSAQGLLHRSVNFRWVTRACHIQYSSGISTMVEIVWTDVHYPILQAGQHYRIY